jgi:hypothetical protein
MKGEATVQRPHRYSRIRTVAGKDAVTILQLAALKPTPIESKKSPIIIKAQAVSKIATTEGPQKMEEFLDWYDIAHKVMVREKNGYKWQIIPCPFNPEHSLGEVAVFVNDDGGYGFKCFHNSCVGNHWQEFKAHLQLISGKLFYWKTNAATAAAPNDKPTSKVSWTCASSISPETVNWLWPNRVPFGKLTMFAGHPGVGKGMATMYIAACASTGKDWQDYKNINTPMKVAIVSSEDAAKDTLVPRLMAAQRRAKKISRLTQTSPDCVKN